MDLRGATVAGAFWIDPKSDELMLASDAGQIIRIHVDGIAPKRRGGAGVRVFNIEADQRVVSVARLSDMGEDDAADGEDIEAVGGDEDVAGGEGQG